MMVLAEIVISPVLAKAIPDVEAERGKLEA